MADPLLIRNARVVPVTTAPRYAEPVDVLVRDGVVAALAPALPDTGERVLDAAGRWLIPGLWDHHVHMLQWARTLTWVDVSGSADPGEVVTRVAAALPDARGPVVTGFGYRSGGWARQPTVAELDAVTGTTPVVLISGDAHNGWLNSAALDLLGLPPRAGVLDETEWFPVFARLGDLPRDTAAEEAAYELAVTRASASGIVGITDLEFGRGFADWPERFARGVDSLRVRAATYAETLEEVVDLRLRTGTPLPGGDGLLTMGPLKIISDGSLNTRTAYCCEPYADEPGNRGKLNVPGDELIALMTRAHTNGIELAVHAIGDAAVAGALDAFAATGARGSIEHAQLMASADIARMAELGVVASVQPAHLLDDRDVTAICWPDRAERCFPLRSLHDAGVRLALGSDAPVSPLDPWLELAAAVHRSGDEREPWNAPESLSPAQALAASTGGQGTIDVGSVADLVVLDADPLPDAPDTAAAAATLRAMPVAATIVAGRVTHDAR